MNSFPLLIDLFQAVLDQSKTIEGRFCPVYRSGAELNSDEMGQVITDVIQDGKFQKYPVAILFPPRGLGEIKGKDGSWMDWSVTMFFLQTSYSDAHNYTRDRNPSTGTSMHPVYMDWQEMATAAVSFHRILSKFGVYMGLINESFRMKQGEKVGIEPVSLAGKDRVSGVRLDFRCSTFFDCLTEDYADDALELMEAKISL